MNLTNYLNEVIHMDLFKNKKKLEQIKNNEQSIAYGESSNVDEEIIPTLSLHPKTKIPVEDRYVYQYYNSEAHPLKVNQLSILAIDHHLKSGAIDVRALIRHSLNKAIKLQKTTIVMMNNQHEVIAEGTFDLSSLGELPPKSSRPYTFRFDKQEIKETVTENSSISLGFKLEHKHRLDLTEDHQKQFTKAQIDQLSKIVAKAPKLKDGEFNFMMIGHQLLENEALAVNILLRNGSKKTIHLQQLPLQLFDKHNDVAAKGVFKLEDFEVKANTSKLHTFIFPKSAIIKHDADLSQCKIAVIEKE